MAAAPETRRATAFAPGGIPLYKPSLTQPLIVLAPVPARLAVALGHAPPGLVARFVVSASERRGFRRLNSGLGDSADDVVVLETPIGSPCKCAELTQRWFEFATRTWPAARYFGKKSAAAAAPAAAYASSMRTAASSRGITTSTSVTVAT